MLRLRENPGREFPDEARRDFEEAVEGGMDYFILAMLDFPPPAANEIPKPKIISLRIYKTHPYKMIHEERYTASGAASAMDDEFTSIKKIAGGLISHLDDK
jgi:hypothetical protein